MTVDKKALEYRNEAIKLREEYEQRAKELKNLDNTTKEWFDGIDENRKFFFKALLPEYKFLSYLNDKQMEIFTESRMGKPRKNNPNYNYHPEITDYNRSNCLNLMSAISGKSIEQIIKVRDKLGNMTELEAYRYIMERVPLRTDKPIIALDLEAASPSLRDMKNQFDFGPRTEIIEVGYIKVWPDGKVKTYSKLFGVDPNLIKTNGTGREDVHNISPKDIEGLTRFVDDLEAQKEIYNDLKDSILLAHNARYEKGQLSHSLRGFNRLLKENRLEVIDTMHLSQFFMPQNENNTNEAFVTNTGGKYEEAHRAFADALMSLNAFMRYFKKPEIEIKKD